MLKTMQNIAGLAFAVAMLLAIGVGLIFNSSISYAESADAPVYLEIEPIPSQETQTMNENSEKLSASTGLTGDNNNIILTLPICVTSVAIIITIAAGRMIVHKGKSNGRE